MSEANSNAGNEDQNTDQLTAVIESVKTLAETVSSQQEALGGIQASVGTLTSKMTDQMSASDAREAARIAAAESNDDTTPEDIDTMTRKEYTNYLTETIIKAVESKLITPLSEKVGSVESTTETTRIQKLVDDASKDHKDFWDWKEEMKVEVTKNPYLTPDEAYILARTKDKVKAKELDTKYENKPDGDTKGKGTKGGFGGLTPSGEKTTPNSRMSKKDAANKAWEDVFSDMDPKAIGEAN